MKQGDTLDWLHLCDRFRGHERVLLSYTDKMRIHCVRPATVCGWSPRMRLDLTVNLLTMQALTKGVITVLGGEQTRPNIHIDDLVDLYLFALERRLAGVRLDLCHVRSPFRPPNQNLVKWWKHSKAASWVPKLATSLRLTAR